MIEIIILLLASIAAYIGTFIPGVSSSLSVGTLILLGIPPQIAKSTYQIGFVGMISGGLYKLIKSNHLRTEYLLILVITTFFGGIVGGQILVSLPTELLVRLTGISMILFLITNFVVKNIGFHARKLPQRYIWIGYISNFGANTLFGIFPAGGGILFHILHTLGFGMSTIEAKTMGKILGFALIPGLLIPLISSGMYHPTYILSYAVGGYIGAHFAVHHALRFGNEFLTILANFCILFMGLYFTFIF